MDQSLNINSNTQTLSANFPLKSPLKLYGFFFLAHLLPTHPRPQVTNVHLVNNKSEVSGLFTAVYVIRPRELYCHVTLGLHSSTKA